MLLPTRKHQKEHPSIHPFKGQCGRSWSSVAEWSTILSLAFSIFWKQDMHLHRQNRNCYSSQYSILCHIFKHDIKWFCTFIQFSHVDVWCNKVILHHQYWINHSYRHTDPVHSVSLTVSIMCSQLVDHCTVILQTASSYVPCMSICSHELSLHLF